MDTTEQPSLSTLYQKIEAINTAYIKLSSSPGTQLAHESLLKIGHQAALLCKDVAVLGNPPKPES